MSEPNLQIVIEMAPNGSVSVRGPINNKALCYGMLEAAKDAVRDHVAKNSSPILKPGVQQVKEVLRSNGGH